MGPPRTQLLCCSSCNQSFARRDHLTRHLRIHTDQKPYQCPLCEKSFKRLDVLNRHTASHEEGSNRSAATAPSRACRQCARERVRCSRGQPCRRCMDRRLPCSYPPATPRARIHVRNHSEGVRDDRMQLTDPVPDQVVAHQLAATFVTGPTHITGNGGDNTASTSFVSAISNDMSHSGDSLAWMGTVSGIEGLYDINQPGVGVSGVNWMSPQYELAIDGDALLSGYAIENGMQHGMHDDGGRSGEGDDHGVSTHQQLQPRLQTGLESEDMRSRSVVGSAVSSNSTEGRYYVDGSGARAPFGGRSHNRDFIWGIETLHEADSDEAISPQSVQPPVADSLCSKAAYDSLVQTMVAETQLQSLDVDIAHFPSHLQMQLYVRDYFKNFNPIFPFLRRASFVDDALTEPLLLLAVSVVGSKYTRRLQGREPGEALFRLLNITLQRRGYGYEIGCDGGDDEASFAPGQPMEAHTCPSLQMLQAGILNITCMMHSGKKALVERAFVERHYLVEACHLLELISQGPNDRGPESATPHYGHESIHKWIRRESEIRTGMMIWFLDSMFLYEFDAKPLMQLDDIKAILPSHEDAWENPDLVQQVNKYLSNMTLLSAMETVYVEKRLPPHLGEFSIGLLVNAIYRNTIQIMAREQIRLNAWTPTATAQHRPEQFSKSPPTTSTTSKWRNSACDCLDVLHWPANSKAAQLSGSEHHTILHLHLARLIILTPTTHIQTFAVASASVNQQFSNLQSSRRYATARQQVLQWVLRDRFKARLSIVHCGALYWHVRRYSCDSVLEPYAIYLATLVLWAFCVSMQLPEAVEAAAHGNDDEPEPSFLHLDRPLDDELVQTFVRLGHKMSAYISKVGNIQSRDAPAKILQEGISLLIRDSHIASSGEHRSPRPPEASCYTWGIEKSYVKSLRELRQATADIAISSLP